MPVEEMLRRMSSTELSEWRLYFQILNNERQQHDQVGF